MTHKLVLVEDNDDAREMLAALLGLSGHDVHTAADGEQGLQLILDTRPDIALIDIGLPRLDGYEVARRVREQIPQVRLVALTGYGQTDDVLRAKQAGFDRHLVKPVDPNKLQEALAVLGKMSSRFVSKPYDLH